MKSSIRALYSKPCADSVFVGLYKRIIERALYGLYHRVCFFGTIELYKGCTRDFRCFCLNQEFKTASQMSSQDCQEVEGLWCVAF